MQILVLVCLTFLILWKTIFTLQLSDQLCIGENKELKVWGELLHGLTQNPEIQQ